MSKVSISEAARLTGKARTTIHRHLDKGKLSKDKDALGNPLVDVSELERVYGALQAERVEQTVLSDKMNSAGNVVNSEALQVELEAIKEQLKRSDEMHERERQTLARQIEDLRGERDEWREQADKWAEQAKSATRLLEDHHEKAARKPSEGSSRFWARLIGRRG